MDYRPIRVRKRAVKHGPITLATHLKRVAIEEEKREESRLASQKATRRAKAIAQLCKVLDAYNVPWEVFQWDHLK
jgi:hypothetical protein